MTSVPAPAPRLEEITPRNIEAALAIRVRPGQEHAVSPVVKSLAEAYVRPGVAWPRLITDGGRPVGSSWRSSTSAGTATAPSSAPGCGG